MKKKIMSIALLTALLLNLSSCAHEHKFGEWCVTKNATCTEEGVKARYCDCGEKQSDAIPFTGHNFVNGKCINCQKAEKEPSTDPSEESCRTTITEDEWNNTLQLNNFTITLEVPQIPEIKHVTNVSENAIYNDLSGYCFYYVNENGAFYHVENSDGVWCKYPNVAGDSSFSSFAQQLNINVGFSDLIYDEEVKGYIYYTENVDTGEKLRYTFAFENGVITQVNMYSITDDVDGFYYITDIGTTTVTVPAYIPLSHYYALKVMPNSGGFEEVDISSYSLPASIREAHKAKNGGYVIEVEFTGYSSGNVIVIGIDANGIVTGAICIESNETWGYEKTLGDKFVGKDANSAVDVEAGATSKTIRGYRSAVLDAISAAKILNGVI